MAAAIAIHEGPTILHSVGFLDLSAASPSNPYWARVESIISSQWEPPPIDMTGQTYRMIVKFRLQRDGTIKDVSVQQSSGNAYFDMAGQRAVLRPRTLPGFPAEMTDRYKDMTIEFRVGGSKLTNPTQFVGPGPGVWPRNPGC